MPYHIVKLPTGQWAKKRADTGKIVSRHATKAKAIGSVIAEASNTGENMQKMLPGKGAK
jgi:hypothetical protein